MASTKKRIPPRKPLMPSMSRYERVWSAVHGGEVDRPPVAFWHHFQPGGSGHRMADVTAEFFDEEFELDIVKIMPDLPYPYPRKSISKIEDWLGLEPLDPMRSRFYIQRMESVVQLRQLIGLEAPIVVTLFSPLTEALYMAESTELFLRHAEESPAIVHEAMRTLAENLRTHNRMMLEAGADGLFFALQGCSTAVMPEQLYREFGRPYDLMALQGTEAGWLNILHVHGEKELMMDLVLDYPVSVLSWSDRIAGPSLREMRAKTSKTLMGGWNEFGAIYKGDVAKIRSEAHDAMKQTGGRKFILAPGCSVPDDIDHNFLVEARSIAEELAN